MIGARMYQIIVLRHRLFGSVNGHMGMLLDCPHGVFFFPLSVLKMVVFGFLLSRLTVLEYLMRIRK